MHWIGIVMLLSVVVISQVGADVDIQYELSTGHVSAARNAPPSIESAEGSGIVTLTGVSAADIMWPIPSGCAAGQPEWSRVTNPETVAANGAGLALRPGLLFFSTTSPLLPGCLQVSSWNELQRLVRSALIASVPDRAIVEALNYHWGWYYARCYDAPTNQNCLDWKSNLNTMLTMYPGRSQGITESAKGATLVTDALNFRAAQVALGTPGW